MDVSGLPEGGFGTKSAPWWGTLGFMLAEGISLAICGASYLYLARRQPSWPPPGLPLPDVLVPTLTMALLLASALPARMLDRAAHRKDARAVTTLLVVGILVEVVILAVRAAEFQALNVRWDGHAYGSVVWFTLGIHTTLLGADLAETATFGAMFLRGKNEEKHWADVADVAMYWHFVVLAWVPLYVLLYWFPRLV